ncbi:BspA family leucine-rich repeat surface protein [Marinicellulosiphila megalodicopiae]|uniref:BspA family leucine-rich repeat surface protein n=1 Tax=Marinicellulosiphila megalodicopiae TaxID=2724896 RepID=UPI003BAEA12D
MNTTWNKIWILTCATLMIALQSCYAGFEDLSNETSPDKTTTSNIQDTQGPEIKLVDADVIDIYHNSTYSELGATVTDNIDHDLDVLITGTVDTEVAGEYFITYQATDLAGNQSTKIRQINVIEVPFIFTISKYNPSDELTLVLNASDGVYNYNVNWTDNVTDKGLTGGVNHTYDFGGPYQVSISGVFPSLQIYCSLYCEITVEQWGSNNWQSLYQFLTYFRIVNINATDSPNLKDIQSLERMFVGNDNVNGNLNNWDTSNIKNIDSMLLYSKNVNLKIDQWDVSNVETMQVAFSGIESHTLDLSKWNVSNLKYLDDTFSQSTACDTDLSRWDVSQVKSVKFLFANCTGLISDVTGWNVSSFENLNFVFGGASLFNQDLSLWDVSNITSMGYLFTEAINFNQNINNWDVSNVNNMQGVFKKAQKFNQTLSRWGVSNVTNMDRMFEKAMSFNQPLDNWNVSNVNTMISMFAEATNFNQNLSTWNVSNVENMALMFANATSFDQDLSAWNISNVWDMEHMFDRVTLSTEHYDALLISWSAQDVQTHVRFSGGNSQYTPNSAASAARDVLISVYKWRITDGGPVLVQ